ncbi:MULTISPECIES: NADH-quinone oxidoreductase subunit B family protein [Methylocaldum]|jgi:coenzyme F420-reducing hydrogenase gamma subunit|uniref:NADH-quinone oxidoreductase subunit B family protein n=1 Tax=unclassified Methylocaldum TaxID=2622260 RepID=UPI00105EA717
MDKKLRVAVHKFSSCDGCQLAFLNAGEKLVELFELADVVHFAEAGIVDPDAPAELAFIEGSISTHEEQERIRRIRENTRFLVPIGACATSGCLQALRNQADAARWFADVYSDPSKIDHLDTATPIAANVPVDLELWGCPVNTRQVMATVSSLLLGAPPRDDNEKICMECKRKNIVCVMVAQGQHCMGPVTRTGCGVLCPGIGRDCYGCYGPAENINGDSWGRWFEQKGMPAERIARRFRYINSEAEAFREAGKHWKEKS